MTTRTQQNAAAALARKRRKNRLHGEKDENPSKRVRVSDSETDGNNTTDDERPAGGLPEDVTSMVEEKKKPHITGIKRSTRYDPGVPMTRDELTAWRKEARRVRNRESAAASRRRTRQRIDELEEQVDELQNKYSAALKKIVELEAAAAAASVGKAMPQTPVMATTTGAVSFDVGGVVSPCASGASSPVIAPASPVTSPRSSFRLDCRAVPGQTQNQPHQEIVETKYQHIMDMISRPTA